ncbi:prolyl aminopeptidase [Kaistia geumhonensis]|uniref:Proline iminopeptidase n=1 Tax=Kaistia geumhonensis TaxID=410839 RepID=A0ABU0MBF7_9HYPH|nr:prolyl aminopeptidase [Kaistia geumhonensis]MCX5481246.1 prolyl aminopeptidase [Kaistia geumhonensis]MDQ0518307.1 proline iminopeptidase [Kaistia geumhonensis]
MIDGLYLPAPPFRSGHLTMPDGDDIYFELSGNPAGRPALYLHGGPGSGLRGDRYRRPFDPERYCILGIDQRGCGRSTPLASERPDRLGNNTTDRLIADIETIRAHLGFGDVVVTGGSWGATLAIAYAEAHPDRVAALVLMAVTTTSRAEVDWMTEAMGRVFPEAWQRFEEASERRPGERIVEAYARRLASGPRDDRLAAAAAWNAWEDTHVALDPNFAPLAGRFDETAGLVFATLATHYFAHDGFRPGNESLLEGIGRIAHVPAVLIHGRRDISSPLVTPCELYRRWPASRLVVIESEGHGGPLSLLAMREALDALAGGGAAASQ